MQGGYLTVDSENQEYQIVIIVRSRDPKPISTTWYCQYAPAVIALSVTMHLGRPSKGTWGYVSSWYSHKCIYGDHIALYMHVSWYSNEVTSDKDATV